MASDPEEHGGTDASPAVEEVATVTLVADDGSTSSVRVGPDETILEATDDTDIDLRYGCREGRCVSCTARLVDGEVHYLEEPQALDERQREEGFVLLCIARPETDCRIRVGRSALAEAFPNLWRSGSDTL